MRPMQKRNIALWSLALVLTASLIGGVTGFFLFSFWDLPEVAALEEYRPSTTSRVYSLNNALLAEFFIENRTPVALADVPRELLSAIIATEDARFYNHRGIDLRGVGRAFIRNLRAGRVVEGGSTLTQQLSKVLFLTPERSFSRKLKEMALALRIEQRYTKREILSLYLNQIYFGSGAYGVEAAAQIYFGKSVRDLDLAECALIAGLPRSPNRYSPFKNPVAAVGRRAYVLNRMAELGAIPAARADEAKRASLPLQPHLSSGGPAPYFVEYIRQKVEERFGSGLLYTGGINVYTSIDDRLQAQAEQSITSGLAAIEKRLRRKKKDEPPVQAALVAIDPSSGRITAMVGGRDFSESQFNRAWQAVRQPGSAFKPIVFAAALERGFGAADLLTDSPARFRIDRKTTWSPENFSKTYQGQVTLRRALTQSLNVPTVHLLEKVGIPETIDYATKLGIGSTLSPYLSLALGSSDVTLLELTSAYAVFANHGVRVPPGAILRITDSTGRVLYTGDAVPGQVMRPETAFLITNLLRGVIENGTAWKARSLGRPAAGKTGTTNEYRDAWFVGYTPSLATGVWVGFDDHRSIGPRETGARAALPIWLDFMKKAFSGTEPEEFAVPEGITFRTIDPSSGLLASDACPRTLREAFLPGTEPRTYCDESAPATSESDIQDEAP